MFSEELILELFDVLSGAQQLQETLRLMPHWKPSRAGAEELRRAGTGSKQSEPSFMQPKSAYDRYRDARDRLRQHPSWNPQPNEVG